MKIFVKKLDKRYNLGRRGFTYRVLFYRPAVGGVLTYAVPREIQTWLFENLEARTWCMTHKRSTTKNYSQYFVGLKNETDLNMLLLRWS